MLKIKNSVSFRELTSLAPCKVSKSTQPGMLEASYFARPVSVGDRQSEFKENWLGN